MIVSSPRSWNDCLAALEAYRQEHSPPFSSTAKMYSGDEITEISPLDLDVRPISRVQERRMSSPFGYTQQNYEAAKKIFELAIQLFEKGRPENLNQLAQCEREITRATDKLFFITKDLITQRVLGDKDMIEFYTQKKVAQLKLSEIEKKKKAL